MKSRPIHRVMRLRNHPVSVERASSLWYSNLFQSSKYSFVIEGRATRRVSSLKTLHVSLEFGRFCRVLPLQRSGSCSSSTRFTANVIAIDASKRWWMNEGHAWAVTTYDALRWWNRRYRSGYCDAVFFGIVSSTSSRRLFIILARDTTMMTLLQTGTSCFSMTFQVQLVKNP